MSLRHAVFESYWAVLNVSADFRAMCISTFIWAGAASAFSWVLLVLRDVIEVSDEKERSYHYAMLNIVGLGAAVFASVLFGWADLPIRQSYAYTKVVMGLYTISDTAVPAPYFLSTDVKTRLLMLYLTAVWKGLAFGLTLNLFQNCFWLEIPTQWRIGVGGIARGMAFQGVMRTTGAALGNTLVGLSLHLWATWFGDLSNEAMDFSKIRYPVSAYVFVHVACVLAGLFALWTVWNVTAEDKTTMLGEYEADSKEPGLRPAVLGGDGQPLLEPEPEQH